MKSKKIILLLIFLLIVVCCLDFLLDVGFFVAYDEILKNLQQTTDKATRINYRINYYTNVVFGKLSLRALYAYNALLWNFLDILLVIALGRHLSKFSYNNAQTGKWLKIIGISIYVLIYLARIGFIHFMVGEITIDNLDTINDNYNYLLDILYYPYYIGNIFSIFAYLIFASILIQQSAIEKISAFVMIAFSAWIAYYSINEILGMKIGDRYLVTLLFFILSMLLYLSLFFVFIFKYSNSNPMTTADQSPKNTGNTSSFVWAGIIGICALFFFIQQQQQIKLAKEQLEQVRKEAEQARETAEQAREEAERARSQPQRVIVEDNDCSNCAGSGRVHCKNNWLGFGPHDTNEDGYCTTCGNTGWRECPRCDGSGRD